MAWSDESRFLLDHVDGRVRVCRLPGDVMAPGCTVGIRQAGGGSVMLWAMFCWETLGPAIHMDINLTRVIYLNIIAEQVHPFMAMVFPDGSGLFQQDNAPCHIIPGGVDSACHPSEVGKMSTSLLVSCVRVATCPVLCPIAKEIA